MKFYRDITAIFTFIIALFLLIGCTPGKAQSRKDGDYQRYNEETGRYTADSKAGKNRHYADDAEYEEQDWDFNGETGRKSAGSVKMNKNAGDYYGEGGDYESDTAGVNDDNDYYQKGTASWYGREFHGKMTASGEKFNMYEMTAAHKTLPFGTVVSIKNLDNGKEATVRINDRGPYKGNRIIDLSYNAAKKIDILSSGMGRVGITILKKGKGSSASDVNETDEGERYVEPVVDGSSESSDYEESASGKYALQAGAFYSRKNAENLQRRVESLTRQPVVIVQDEDLYKVRINNISGRKEAERQKRILSDEDISSFIVNSQE